MPYINRNYRMLVTRQIDDIVRELRRLPAQDRGGVLNYIVTCLVHNLADRNYASLRGYVGDLQCCVMELYRRLIGPYEDEKIQQNGDVP